MRVILSNPIIPGFAPDPSVVYVDGTYFLVNSSFHLFPGLPIYASRDLCSWTHIGNAFNRPQQLDIQQSSTRLHPLQDPGDVLAAQGGLYAASIRHHKGTFYVICTNVRPRGPQHNDFENFILSTSDIWADEWSDPVFFDFNGIDTSLFWDEDDRVYVVGSASPAPATTIRQFEIDITTGKKLSEERLLWEGITKVFPEGPHMYKKDGWYYLLIAEGGCFAGHHSIMARSRNIWGPFEPNAKNPVMERADARNYIQYTGHGDLIQDAAGQWYFICLGVRKTPDGRFIMGRESMITTADWPEGEFPTIHPAQQTMSMISQPAPASKLPVRRSKTSFTSEVDLLHIRNPSPGHYRYHERDIFLRPSHAGIHQADDPVSFVGKRQRSLRGEASVTMQIPGPRGPGDGDLEAGLCYYKDELRFVRVALRTSTRQVIFEVRNKAKGIQSDGVRHAGHLFEGGEIGELSLGISYSERLLSFWFETADGRVGCGEVDTLVMTGHDFVGPVIGVFAVGSGETPVRFSKLSVD